MQSLNHLFLSERRSKERESFSDNRDWEGQVRNGHHHPQTRSLIGYGSDLAYDPATVTVCLSLFHKTNKKKATSEAGLQYRQEKVALMVCQVGCALRWSLEFAADCNKEFTASWISASGEKRAHSTISKSGGTLGQRWDTVASMSITVVYSLA